MRSFGLSPEDRVDDDWALCRALAEPLRIAGVRGVIVASAALSGTSNVVLFGAHLASPYLAPPIDSTIESPTAHVAEQSIPPREVVDLVRWHGETHPGPRGMAARTLRVPRPDSAEPVKRHRPRPRENPRPGGLALAGSACLLDAPIFSLSSAIGSGQAVWLVDEPVR